MDLWLLFCRLAGCESTFHSFLWDHYCFALLTQREESILDKKARSLQNFIKELCVCVRVCLCAHNVETTQKKKKPAVMFTITEHLQVLWYVMKLSLSFTANVSVHLKKNRDL